MLDTIEPKIVFEDDAIVVLDKPAGLQSTLDGHEERPTVAAFLAERYPGAQLAHRLDRETSGIIIAAKNAAALQELKRQFKEREIQKTYRAFIYGHLQDTRGIIDRPVGSARGGRAPRSATRPYGNLRSARTVYKLLGKGDGTSYIEAFPQTGRTHQIRAHFAAIQHPLVCDKQYAPSRPCLLGFERLALHALSLSLKHPVSGEEVMFQAPLPLDFGAAEQELRNA